MSFPEILQQYKNFSFQQAFKGVELKDISEAINSDKKTPKQLIALLSQEAKAHLEIMAGQAQNLSLQHFGKAIVLYTPLYLSNYCENQCLYCGFNTTNPLIRKKLTLEEIKKEAETIAAGGLRQLLILTGDSRKNTPLPYIKDCIGILKNYFSSISIEIYVLEEKEYKELALLGIDGVTLYQEVYDEATYTTVHPAGPKKNYQKRLNAPEDAAKCGIRTINLGALLGLADFKKEAFFLLLHAQYLQNKYPDVEISVSVPRIRPQTKDFKPFCAVSDADLVQLILAARIFMPRLGITLSTRENEILRDNLIPLGITKISAGSTTVVGGHGTIEPYDKCASQFEIADRRSVEEMKKAILTKGYQPVLKDWVGCSSD